MNFLPHGYCFAWTPGLLWSMVAADASIALAYFSIPVAIVAVVRRRGDSSVNSLALLFSAFIFACGMTHVMDVWTIWEPSYRFQTFTKIVTAALSVITAVATWQLIPVLLGLPTPREWRSATHSLEEESQRRMDAENDLFGLQQNLAVTLASIGAGLIATDRRGRVTHMNAVAEALTGWNAVAARGRPLGEVFVPADEDGQSGGNPVDRLIAAGTSVTESRHLDLRGPGGERFEIELKTDLTHAPDGSVRGLALVFRDLSRLARAEVDASRLAAIVASSNDSIFAKTLDGTIFSWNSGAEAMFGYTAEEILGQTVFKLVPPQRVDEERRVLERLARGEQVPTFETLRVAKDGTLKEVSVTASPVRDGQGRIVGVSSIARDVSQRRLAEEARLKALRLEAENRQIQESNRLKSLFLANMSHELRTPLNAIIGFSDLLESGAVPPESAKHAEFLGYIGTSGRHLLQVINDVLDLSKVESGRFEFHPEPVRLSPVVREVADVLRTAMQDRHVPIHTQIAADAEELQVDPARLKQVLYNYLSNAIKFSEDGAPVTVRARALPGERIGVEVEDHGVGIAAADLERLFTEFHQLDGGLSRRHQGTGLGLALTRRLIEAQGGSVGVTSEPGRGSVFYFVIDRVYRRPSATGPLQTAD